MNFTNTERELASQLKEVGLEWKPKIGDHYIYDLESKRDSIVTDIDHDRGDKGWIYVRSPSDGLRNINLCCWLPLWHQCREELQDLKWIVASFFDLEGHINLRIIKEKENPSQVLGIEFDVIAILDCATDLEALYKGLLEAANQFR